MDLRAGSSVQELRGHQSSILSVKWSPNFSFLASGCLGGQVLLWDIRKARNCLMSLDMGNLKGKGTVFENRPKKSHSTFRAKRAKFYILSGHKFIKNAKNGQFLRVFENLKIMVKQCYQIGHF